MSRGTGDHSRSSNVSRLLILQPVENWLNFEHGIRAWITTTTANIFILESFRQSHVDTSDSYFDIDLGVIVAYMFLCDVLFAE